MNFSYRVGNIEARGNEERIEIVKWYWHNKKEVCYVLAFVKSHKDEEAYLESVGLRIWVDIKMVEVMHKAASDFMMKVYMEEQ